MRFIPRWLKFGRTPTPTSSLPRATGLKTEIRSALASPAARVKAYRWYVPIDVSVLPATNRAIQMAVDKSIDAWPTVNHVGENHFVVSNGRDTPLDVTQLPTLSLVKNGSYPLRAVAEGVPEAVMAKFILSFHPMSTNSPNTLRVDGESVSPRSHKGQTVYDFEWVETALKGDVATDSTRSLITLNGHGAFVDGQRFRLPLA